MEKDYLLFFFFFQAEDGIRDKLVTGVQTCALPIWGDDRDVVTVPDVRLERLEFPRAVRERLVERQIAVLEGIEGRHASDYTSLRNDRYRSMCYAQQYNNPCTLLRYAGSPSAAASSAHRAALPAAARRDRPSRSSSAWPNGRGSSKSSSARPTSRQRSCAAAMSTDRAALSEQTASTRPAARWQSESASEPMIRSRCARPTIAGACAAISEVRVASKLRISIRSFGLTPPSGSPFTVAPSPRRPTHSSPVPKS